MHVSITEAVLKEDLGVPVPPDFCLWSETGSLDAHRGCWLQSRGAKLSLSVLFPPAFETQPEIQSGLHRKQFFPGDVYLKGMKPCALTANTQNWIYCFKMLSCTCTHPYCMCICWIFFIICWYSLIWGWWICIYVSSFSTNRYVEENVFILAIKMIVNNAFNKQLMQ